MILRLFKAKTKTSAPSLPAVPEGTVVWAVGDVHGRLDLLKSLVDAIIADARGMSALRKVVIFLGDYVDRGPASRGVLRYLLTLPAHDDIEWRFLKGNHEETMLKFLDNPGLGNRWCDYGGDATLESYGLRPPTLKHVPEAWRRVAADLRHAVAREEISFLGNLEGTVTLGDYFFCHAGARPGVPLDQQAEEDFLWIRQSFLNSEAEFECVVVHGHTPTRTAHVDRRRIGIDTRAYSSGVLTALRLQGTDRRVIQAVGPREAADPLPVAIHAQPLELATS